MIKKFLGYDASEQSSISERIAKAIIGSVVFSIGISVIKRVLPILWVLYP